MAYPLFHERGPKQTPLAISPDQFVVAFPGEGNYIEFKQGIPEAKIAEAVAAFSNSDGGVVLLGVSDNGRVHGLEPTGESEAKVHRAVRQVRDAGRYSLHRLDVGDRTIMVLAVSVRREGFAQLQDGRVLLRRGAMNVPAIGQELSRFVTERALSRFESSPTQTPLVDADPDLVDRLARAFGWRGHDHADRLVEIGLSSGVNTDDQLTVAGVLYLTQRPADALGKAHIEIFRHRGTSSYDRRLQIDGPVDQQVRDAVRELMAELGTDVVILGLKRHELPRIPAEVLREAIANAVAHRNYEVAAQSVRIDIWPDRVVIKSPGGLPEPVTLENIREQSAPRNLDLIKILRRLRIAEDAGLGVDLMQDQMEAAMLQPPTFDTDGSFVSVELAIGSTVAPDERAWLTELGDRGAIRPDERLILLHAARGNPLTNSAVRDVLHVDSVRARQCLTRLRDLGFLHQDGERGGATYSLAVELSPPAGLQLDREQLRKVILAVADEQGQVTNESVRARTGLDRAKVLTLLTSMVGDGELIRHGERRGSFYTRP